MLVFMVPIRFWQQGAPWFFMGGMALLVLVLIPGVSHDANGARRWINLVVFKVQPSELMKLAVVLYAADYTVRKHAVLKNFRRGLLPMLGVMLLVAWLLLREPDFGALVVITVTSFGNLFLGGMNLKHFGALAFCLTTALAVPIVSSAQSAVTDPANKHNLSTGGPGPAKATTATEICVFCHTPHSSADATPLWNQIGRASCRERV